MLNPQIHSSMISPRMMYSYDRGTNKTWNMAQYKTPKIYQDPKLQIQKRKWAQQEKGKKDLNYVTKRGFYMDYDLKQSKSVPASSKHGRQQPWEFKKQKKLAQHIKIDQKLKKYTYLQQIQTRQKNHKVPGVSTYSLQKSLKQKQQQIQKLTKKVLSKGQKRYFYQNTQLLSNQVPGPGNDNPHDVIDKTKSQRHDYNYWVKKHKKENDFLIKRQMKKPTANTYRALHQSFRSFDLTSRNIDISPKKSLQKKNWFGSDSKFQYTRPNKKKIKQVRPSPSSYNTGIGWKGKSNQKKPKLRDWSQVIWKGSQNNSIYNSK